MIVIEMSKLNARMKTPVEDISWLEAWSILFSSADKPACREFINNLINTKEEIKMATELLMEISQDERQRAIMRSRKMYETDMMSRMLAEKRLGKMEERQNNIRLMYRLGLGVDTIAQAFDLSEQEVKNILDSKAG